MIPWALFGLTARDLSGELLRNWPQIQSVVTATGLALADFTVPPDKAALISGWSVEFRGAGASYGAIARLQVWTPGAGTLRLSRAQCPFSALISPIVQNAVNAFGEHILAGPNELIHMEGQFSTAVAGSVCVLSFSSVLIPRGDAAWL